MEERTSDRYLSFDQGGEQDEADLKALENKIKRRKP